MTKVDKESTAFVAMQDRMQFAERYFPVHWANLLQSFKKEGIPYEMWRSLLSDYIQASCRNFLTPEKES